MDRSILRVALLAADLLAFSCVPVQGSAGTSAPTIAAPSASPSPSGLPAGIKRAALNPPATAAFSPDGRYVAFGSGQTLTIVAIDGTSSTSAPGYGAFRWLPDSSGLFVATSAPQRAGPLAIVALDGKITALPLELTNPMVSTDGTIVAEHQEGCCMNIVQRELRVAQRNGGPARLLVGSSAPAATTQSIVLLGIDGQDRVLYRDGERIGIIPVSGGPSAELTIPRGLVPPVVLADSVSPDRSVILLRTYEPTAEWMLFKGQLMPFPSEAGTIVRSDAASKGRDASAVWLGPQTILVRMESGMLGSYDLAKYTPGHGSNAMQTVLPYVDADGVLAYRDGWLLWRGGDHVHLLAVGTRKDQDTGLVLETQGATAGAIAGGFLLISGAAAYEISAP